MQHHHPGLGTVYPAYYHGRPSDLYLRRFRGGSARPRATRR